MTNEEIKKKILKRLHRAYGSDLNSGCYVNGKWLSVNAVVRIVLEELKLNDIL